ncbi:type VII secretion integral membrane protein EccD [Streptomyces sp. ISL-98]|uniref:type VII secretion integral membrane protein EccD n=1 Tax=Streptomyces sp. ISL-98 TaxID=2819192 RepID=UPI001BEBB0C0|nr:type VII secretion integral membrane protein EccD [Streptomyces sp. ISL-98]MBT2509843.1 type VII secretion integral membrane protein EccD [Streptomyces sp. ISL-98]
MGTLGAAVQRTELSRVTLVGDRRRIDLVLPSDEPVGRLLPEVIRLLGDRVAAQPMLRQLVTTDGSVIAQESTLAAAEVPDGAVLRLVRVEDIPSASVVHDVTDEVAEDLGVRAWRWRPATRRVTAGIVTVGLVVTAAMLARAGFSAAVVGAVLPFAALVLAVGGALAGRLGNRGLATTLIASSGALAVLGAWWLADAHGWSGSGRLAGVAGAGALMLLLLGWFSPLGRGGLIGAGAVAVSAVGWEVVAAVQSGAGTAVQQARLGTVLAVASVVVLGVLPRLALMAAGLTRLDDTRSGGASVSRHQVATALAAAHRGLALTTVVMAVSAGAAGLLVVREPRAWTVTLASVVAMVLLLRARAFPLVAEVVVLLAVGLALVVRLAMLWLEHSAAYGPIVLVVGLAVAGLVVLAVEPAEHVRVRLRRIGDLAESVGVVVLFPLAIGVYGVYGRLLDTFR